MFSATDRPRPPDDVKRRWDEIKAEEKKEKGESAEDLLGGVPRNLPALVEAQQIASRSRRRRASTGITPSR